MHWIVSNNMFNEEGFARLLAAFERLGSKYTLVKVVPFSHELVPEPVIEPGENVCVLGTYTLCNVATARGWTPGSFDNENFDYRVQVREWPGAMMNQGAWFGRFADIKPLGDRPFFLRPVHDTKSFIGQVMDWPSFERWREEVLALTPEDQPTITADTMVMVAPKREIWSEARVWVVDGIAVTGSYYKSGTLKRYEELASRAPQMRRAEELARSWMPSRAYVVDVADVADVGLRVVEVNNLNAAGFYAGDMQKLVGAIEAMQFTGLELK